MNNPKKIETLNSLKNQIKDLKAEVDALKKDRQIYRDFMSREFKTQLTNMIQKTYTPGEELIKRMTQALNRAESFYLGF